MELIQSSNRDEAARLVETSCPLKGTEDIWFRCCSCTYFTKDQHGIVSHLVAHGDEQAECHHPLMSPGSRSQVHTNTHMHRGIRLFKCKLCPQAFNWKSNLTRHNLLHTGERPYKCKQCPRAFAQSGSLVYHNHAHTGEKPFKCKFCSQTFSQNSSLIRHSRRHNSEKP
uniref:Putative similar to zinc finger protein n=1 Tax=Ixodes ricinus TaxID=34613 RepID=A0A0K8RIT5_IXORI